MKSRAGETVKEEIEMIRADATMPGCICKVNIRIRVTLLDERPKPLESTGVDNSPSNFRQRERYGDKRIMWQKVSARAFPFHSGNLV